jgi:hypothetical protein
MHNRFCRPQTQHVQGHEYQIMHYYMQQSTVMTRQRIFIKTTSVHFLQEIQASFFFTTMVFNVECKKFTFFFLLPQLIRYRQNSYITKYKYGE